MSGQSQKFQAALECGYAAANCNPERGILLAVSGGADSVALLHGTVAWLAQQSEISPSEAEGRESFLIVTPTSLGNASCEKDSRPLSNRLAVAHVNHRLRGDDSDADANFVAGLAREHGLPFELLTIAEGSLQLNSRGSLEEACRKARYQLLGGTAERLGFASVATAHHQDDQAETILHNIIRGTGLRGLAGMQPSRPLNKVAGASSANEAAAAGSPSNNSVSLVRPMLNISRAAIEEFLASHCHEYCEDHTNQDTAITRNRIRHELLPLLAKDFNPQVARTLVSLGQQAANAACCLDDLADQLLDQIVLEAGADICRLNTDRLGETSDELLRHALTQLWTRLSWPRQKMTFEHWQRLAVFLRTPESPSLQLPGKVSTSREESLVRLTRAT